MLADAASRGCPGQVIAGSWAPVRECLLSRQSAPVPSGVRRGPQRPAHDSRLDGSWGLRRGGGLTSSQAFSHDGDMDQQDWRWEKEVLASGRKSWGGGALVCRGGQKRVGCEARVRGSWFLVSASPLTGTRLLGGESLGGRYAALLARTEPRTKSKKEPKKKKKDSQGSKSV
jgi:hypothetical protein